MSNIIKAQDITSGDVIDLDELARELDTDATEPHGTVESISIEGEDVRIVTDGGTVEVPVNFGVWVFAEAFGR